MKCLIKAEFSCENCGQVGEGQIELEWNQPADSASQHTMSNISCVGVPKGWRELPGFGKFGAGRALFCGDCRDEKEAIR